ncbi:hypothetical protein [Nocardioides sp. Root140]|uniref:hypothetical protein n=1 Tax=Nocardioides sp. Root140 TaxID=1736460 RepID=UPI0006F79E92|nr:hypothetical protein [Nocardioides sp. Root140]KQY50152.1 hypothetical protein ASD30_21735 [Nocardioides sp. Root140]
MLPADAVFEQPEQRIIEAVAHLPPGFAVTGWASLHLAGARYFDGTVRPGVELPVQVITPTQRVHGNVAFTRAAVHPSEIVLRHGVPCTDVHRALTDEICAAIDVRRAVADIDMVLHAELTSRARFATYLAAVPPRRGIQQARRALALAVEGAESRQETAMRLVWQEDAGLPPPLSNRDVYGPAGQHLARPDLLAPGLGVVGEYDGLHHAQTARRSRDISRETRLRTHGLEFFSFVAGELHDRRTAVRRMVAAVTRAGKARLPQTWTLEPPDGVPPLTLDERIRARELGRDGERVTREMPRWPFPHRE